MGNTSKDDNTERQTPEYNAIDHMKSPAWGRPLGLRLRPREIGLRTLWRATYLAGALARAE
eukprot:1204769-Lingulodinium_polyedra.AAC.1